MRYLASEKLEIIRLVEESTLPVRTLGKIGIPHATFYRWYDLYHTGGPEALEDQQPKPDRVWNRIPDDVRERIIRLALDEPALSPRELAVRFTDTEGYFVSEASVYRLLKAHDLIASPAFIVMKAADEFKDKTTAPNQLWQTDFTYLKVIGWGVVLPVDGPRRLLPLHHRLEAVHHDEGRGRHRHARNGAGCFGARQSQGPPSTKVAVGQWLLIRLRRPGEMDGASRHGPRPRSSIPPDDPGQDRALASDVEEPHPAGELLPAGRPASPDRGLRGRLQPSPLSREHRQSNPGRRLLRTRPDNPAAKRKDQTPDHHTTPLAAPMASRLMSSTRRARASLERHCSLSQKL